MLDSGGRRHVRPDGLVLGHRGGWRPAKRGDLLVLVVLLLIGVVGAVFEVRVGYGLGMMVHRSTAGRCRVDVAGW